MFSRLMPGEARFFDLNTYSLGHGGNDAQKSFGIIWMPPSPGGWGSYCCEMSRRKVPAALIPLAP